MFLASVGAAAAGVAMMTIADPVEVNGSNRVFEGHRTKTDRIQEYLAPVVRTRRWSAMHAAQLYPWNLAVGSCPARPIAGAERPKACNRRRSNQGRPRRAGSVEHWECSRARAAMRAGDGDSDSDSSSNNGHQPWRSASYVRAPAALRTRPWMGRRSTALDSTTPNDAQASLAETTRPGRRQLGPEQVATSGYLVLPAQVAESLALQRPGAARLLPG